MGHGKDKDVCQYWSCLKTVPASSQLVLSLLLLANQLEPLSGFTVHFHQLTVCFIRLKNCPAPPAFITNDTFKTLLRETNTWRWTANAVGHIWSCVSTCVCVCF